MLTPPQSSGDAKLSIDSLAQQVTSLSSQITNFLAANSHPQLNFRPQLGTHSVPDDQAYEALRAPLNDAALDLLRLVNGPKNSLRSLFFTHYDLAALQVALDRRLFHHVPLQSDYSQAGSEPKATIAEIASKADMDEDRTGRVMRLLATHRIFEEIEGQHGTFRHTDSSAVFAKDHGFYAMADMQMDDMFKAASYTSTSIDRKPFESDAVNSPFHEMYGTTMYQFLQKNPAKATRFAQTMSSWSQGDRQIEELIKSFPWASIGEGTVVDIGGGSGHVSLAIGKRFPSTKFIVQDISSHMLSQGGDDLAGRITFQKHDFFTDQPVYGASAYLLRQCIHNHNDKDSVAILRAIVPALARSKPQTPLLINDVVLPDSNTVTRFEERHLRQVDFCMMVTLGAKQRNLEDWSRLLKMADERLSIADVHRNSLGIGLIVVHLDTTLA